MNTIGLIEAFLKAHPDDDVAACALLDAYKEECSLPEEWLAERVENIRKAARTALQLTLAASHCADGSPLRPAIHCAVRRFLRIPVWMRWCLVVIPGNGEPRLNINHNDDAKMTWWNFNVSVPAQWIISFVETQCLVN